MNAWDWNPRQVQPVKIILSEPFPSTREPLFDLIGEIQLNQSVITAAGPSGRLPRRGMK